MTAFDRLSRMCGPQVPPELLAELAAHRTETLNEAIEAARSEYFTEITGTPEVETYNNAVSDVVAAIGALLESSASAPVPVQSADVESGEECAGYHYPGVPCDGTCVAQPLSPEREAEIRNQLGDAQPASNGLLVSFGESIRDRRDHEHNTQHEDWFCMNLAAYMGERMALVLRRLLDTEAELGRVRTELADQKRTTDYFDAQSKRRNNEIRALRERLHNAAMAKVWTNEDGKKFVFVADLTGPLLGLAEKAGEQS